MAWLEQRGNRFRIKYRNGGQNLQCSLKTKERREAENCLSRFEENLWLYERGRLEIPPDADVGLFLLSDGKLTSKPKVPKTITLGELLDHYDKHLPAGIKEQNTRYTEQIHIKHLKRILGPETPVNTLTALKLQDYIDHRSGEEGRNGDKVCHLTIRKELVTLSYVWRKWGVPKGLIQGSVPTQGLLYVKTKEKPPFQTREQIERRLHQKSSSGENKARLWESLYLNRDEVAEVLQLIEKKSDVLWYAMFVIAAFTGIRRSEMIRSQVEDVDFAGGQIVIREKKRDKSKECTFRTVPMCNSLSEALQKWFRGHPGGQNTFCHEVNKPLTTNQVSKAFRSVLDGSKWSVIPGWHTFRHSFASNLAAASIDQRIIDAFMGHQTEDMRKRYRHLFPEKQLQAIELAFG